MDTDLAARLVLGTVFVLILVGLVILLLMSLLGMYLRKKQRRSERYLSNILSGQIEPNDERIGMESEPEGDVPGILANKPK